MREDVAIHLLTQITNAISYLHNANIIHRDIKLENIMLSIDETVVEDLYNERINIEEFFFKAKIRVIDLGVSKKLADNNSRTKTYIGSDYTMPPEVKSK
jgi:serine/threonine protein kinase